MKNRLVILLIALLVVACGRVDSHFVSFSGEWSVRLDSLDVGLQNGWQNIDFQQKMLLPGTTDDAQLGIKDTLNPALTRPQLSNLTRRNRYVGAAWYTTEIEVPQSVEGKSSVLLLERVLWTSDVWVDGQKVVSSENNSLSAPHRYDLTSYLRPGQKQRLTILIDNRKQHDISVDDMAHAYTDQTQIMWNGILGRIGLEVEPLNSISQLDVFPDAANRSAKVEVKISACDDVKDAELELVVVDKKSGKQVGSLTKDLMLVKGNNSVAVEYELGSDAMLWDEFSPVVYQLNARLTTEKGVSQKITGFGLRDIERRGNEILINALPVFMRGTLECCIFPLTGYPPLDEKGWEKAILTAKEWGLNHLRFHSWCPPKAAFEVADREGVYLQVELPLWALTLGSDEGTTNFLSSEANRIMREYGNHPSFCFWSMGNELQGDMNVPNSLMKVLKEVDNRHLYTTTSFTFEPGYGSVAAAGDDVLITQWTPDGWVRGQGVFNDYPPSFDRNYATSVQNTDIPIITHEIGQYSVYPNLREIEKYTGVLRPLNFESVREDLRGKGLLDKADSYMKASGKLAAILYKEEIERALKTGGISGFQLLDLRDFPGQGTALVGLLDAFWDSKGVITAERFREFSAPIVPLFCFEKATYRSDEPFKATIDFSNYSNGPIDGAVVEWRVIGVDGQELTKGDKKVDIAHGYNSNLGAVEVDLSSVTKAQKLDVELALKGTNYKNSWSIWVYPLDVDLGLGDVIYTQNYNEAVAELKKGKKVLFNPDWRAVNGIQGKFVPVFWSPVHFPKQAGTMGLLCDANDKALSDFPNDGHSDWQWWDLCVNSTTMVIDSIRGTEPIVEVVDNFINNRRLAMIFEGEVYGGELVVVSCDLSSSAINKSLAARQMLSSLLGYMNSDDFRPSRIENPEALASLITTNIKTTKESATSIY